jgi:hypothetical protein
VFIANNNAYAPQTVRLRSSRKVSGEQFRRNDRRWDALELRDGVIEISLAPGSGELLRFKQ